MADLYFDFSATNNGDGTDPAQASGAGLTGAYNTLNGVTFSANDQCWFRRTASVDDPAAQTSITVDGVCLRGWPISGDAGYADRPAAGTTEGWDSDGADYPIINNTSGTYALSITGNYGVMQRIQINHTGNYIALLDADGWTFENVDFDGEMVATQKRLCVSINTAEIGNTFINCRFAGCMPDTVGSLVNILGHYNNFYACNFEAERIYPYNPVGIVTVGGNSNTFSGCVSSENDQAQTNGGPVLSVTGKRNLFKGWKHTQDSTSKGGSVYITGFYNRVEGMEISGYGGPITITSDYNYVDIDVLDLPASSGTYAINLTGADGNFIRLQELTSSSDTTSAVGFQTGIHNTVVVKDLTWNTAATTFSSTGRNIMYSLNHGGVSGDWIAIQRYSTVESVDVARTGGGSFSLKAETTNIDSMDDGGVLLGTVDAEIMYASLASGANNIEFYGAHKGFTDDLTINDIFIEVQYLSSQGARTTVQSVGDNGTFATDSSTWTGDTGLTEFKFSVDVTLPEDQICAVRLRYRPKYEASAICYIDPVPVIT